MFLSKLKAMFPAVLAAAVVLGGLTVAALRNEAAGQPPGPPVNPPPALSNQPQQAPRGLPGAGGTTPIGKLRLPTGPAPVQALASMGKDGRVILRMAVPDATVAMFLNYNYVGAKETLTTDTSRANQETSTAYRRGEVRVFDIHGREVDWAFLPKLLDQEVLALAAVGERVDPLHLRLTKEGTLVFVIPQPKQPGAPRGAGQQLRTEPGGGPGPGRLPDGATKAPPGASGPLGPRSEPPAGDRPGIVRPPTQLPPAGSSPPTRRGQITAPPDLPVPGDAAPAPPTRATPPAPPPGDTSTPFPTRATPPAPPPGDTQPESGDKNPFRPGDVSPPHIRSR